MDKLTDLCQRKIWLRDETVQILRGSIDSHRVTEISLMCMHVFA